MKHMHFCTLTENLYKNCQALILHLWPFESNLGARELQAWAGGTTVMLNFTFFI